ncbi:MAG: hypothetical protein ACJ8EF_18900 [Bradyrhizobium sp.]
MATAARFRASEGWFAGSRANASHRAAICCLVARSKALVIPLDYNTPEIDGKSGVPEFAAPLE